MNKATLAEYGVHPTVTLHNQFMYAGHVFAVLVYQDDTSDDASWSLESTFAGSYLGGTYPTMYAVIEAVECIEDALSVQGIHGDNIFTLVNGLLGTVRELIANGTFGGVN
jgi:hypothetical protein